RRFVAYPEPLGFLEIGRVSGKEDSGHSPRHSSLRNNSTRSVHRPTEAASDDSGTCGPPAFIPATWHILSAGLSVAACTAALRPRNAEQAEIGHLSHIVPGELTRQVVAAGARLHDLLREVAHHVAHLEVKVGEVEGVVHGRNIAASRKA